jgi:hypothetical protein
MAYDSTVQTLAAELQLEPALVQAVCSVEASGSGFLPAGAKTPSGRDIAGSFGCPPGSSVPKILFEPHVFWKQLQIQKPPYNPAKLLTRADVRAAHGDLSDILYQKQGSRPYGSFNAQWDRLDRAAAICRPAAYESASWGAYQIMAYHWKTLGWPDLDAFIADMYTTEGQARAFAAYLRVNKLVPVLAARDFVTFAKRYNGPGYARNAYDVKLRAAYEKAKRAEGEAAK